VLATVVVERPALRLRDRLLPVARLGAGSSTPEHARRSSGPTRESSGRMAA
jgi:hypothetical protein